MFLFCFLSRFSPAEAAQHEMPHGMQSAPAQSREGGGEKGGGEKGGGEKGGGEKSPRENNR